MPTNNPYDQYKKTQISTANQGKLIVMLYEGAIKFLNIAVENMAPPTYDIVNTNILKAQDIIAELITSLNMEAGGEVAQNLFSLYMYFKKRLLEANISKEATPLKEVIKFLEDLKGAWDKISTQESKNDVYTGRKGNFSIEG